MPKRSPPMLFVPAQSAGLCGVSALATLSARDFAEVRRLASPFFQHAGGGLVAVDLFNLGAHLMGRAPRLVSLHRPAQTAEEAARDRRLSMVVARAGDLSHVMPVVEGALFNKCGYGGEEAVMAFDWEPRRGEIKRIIDKWGR